MDHFAGLDVSVKETSVCIVDDTGKIVREVKVASEPDALLAVLTNPAYHFKRIGLEAGPLSQWLFSCSRRSRLAGDLRRDAAHAGGIEGADQQDRPQRCARHRADDAGGALSSGACEDAAQSEAANAADPSQAAAVEGHRHRERSARHVAQLRSQGGRGGNGEVRGADQGACREASPTWSCWSNRCSLSGGRFASRSASCIAACWPSCGTMMCAGA